MKILWLFVFMLLTGIVRAQEKNELPIVDFAALFQAAATDRTAKQIIVADDFEQGIIQRVVHDPKGDETGFLLDAPAPRLHAMLACDPSGKAGMSVSEVEAVSGSKAIRLQDSSSATHAFMPALNWWLYGKDRPRGGHLSMAFDLLIPEDGGCAFELMARDYSESRMNKPQNFQLLFDLRWVNGRVVMNGESLPVNKSTWMHVQIVLPLGDSGEKFRMTVTDTLSGARSIEQPLARMANTVSFIGILLPDNTDGHVFLDNIVITATE